MMLNAKGKTSRNLLAYFLETKTWKVFEEKIVENVAYWMIEDPARACNMNASRLSQRKGYTVGDWLSDVHQCIYESSYKRAIKDRLYKEIEDIEALHMEQDTLKEML